MNVAITYARMNPPTLGHERLVDVMAKTFWCHYKFLYLSGSEGDKKNPLTFDYKLKLCKEAFNGVDVMVMEQPKKDFFDAVKSVAQHGYSCLTVVVGTDRAEELRKRLNMYNGPGKLYNFYSIEVLEVPRGEKNIISNISATQLRDAAVKNDLELFEAFLPIKLRHRAEDIFREVRNGCLSLENT